MISSLGDVTARDGELVFVIVRDLRTKGTSSSSLLSGRLKPVIWVCVVDDGVGFARGSCATVRAREEGEV